ncbi:kinase-like domain-containing protein [Rhizophagus clarus]|nr:kinase-like domain-containing protein [Rhizophagus clarus]
MDEKCQECGQKDNGRYCQPCNSVHFCDNFPNWSSGDSNLDKLIQNSQLNATKVSELIEWIEYSNFENIEFIAHGGFGSIYKATWKDGPISVYTRAWDFNKSEWQRENNKEVAIKKFRNLSHINTEFLNEVNTSLKLGGFANIVSIYGVTYDTQNDEYAIITKFQNGGNLREMIKKNHNKLTWDGIIRVLIDICGGLSLIHDINYCHKDFHSGNILNGIFFDKIIEPAISDFGQCRHTDQSFTDKTPYGVLPFVAPEVLCGGEFTEAVDIYGLGMIMFEVINGEPPFADREYDVELALAICNGLRPQIPEYTPEPYAELMKRCWDPVPINRPTAYELFERFCNLFVFNKGESSKFSEDKSGKYNEDKEDKPSILNENKSSELHEFGKDKSIEFNVDYSNELNKLLEWYLKRIKLENEKVFSQEREDKWKARLAELATNPTPLKKSQNLLTSKRLDYSQYLSQKLTVEDWNKLKLTE